jgi:thiamine-phosphate pyrophosphorylase
MLLYYITDRLRFAGNESARRERLLVTIAAAAQAGVDYVQLRERDLNARDLASLAGEAVQAVQEGNHCSCRPAEAPRTRFMINSRTDVALAVGADGVHLPSGDLAPREVRALWSKSAQASLPGGKLHPIVASSCHTAAEVRLAEANGADFAVFAPVFEKSTFPARKGAGLAALREACCGLLAVPGTECICPCGMPVLALGGVTLENARTCLEAGAAGVAGIRLFQDPDVREAVARLRG